MLQLLALQTPFIMFQVEIHWPEGVPGLCYLFRSVGKVQAPHAAQLLDQSVAES